MKKRPEILTIAGFDPSGGAGILADIKVYEAFRCYGLAVQTANTIQDEKTFIDPNWINDETIHNQLDQLSQKHHFKWVKIGMIRNLDLLKSILDRKDMSGSKIIWDPILATSSGFDLGHDLNGLDEILKKMYLITPNWNEIKVLSGEEDAKAGAGKLADKTLVYLKGGHSDGAVGKDYLFGKDFTKAYNPKLSQITEKHGSGCVFSSALTSGLAKGYPLHKAVLRAKRYVEFFLKSSPELLGYHK